MELLKMEPVLYGAWRAGEGRGDGMLEAPSIREKERGRVMGIER